MDKLDTIFSLQAELNRRIGVKPNGLSREEQTQWILNYTRALQQEASELIDCVPWKWWKKHQQFDYDNARMEVIDLFHFVISLAQILDLSAEDFFKIYVEKNKINHERQDQGY